MVLNFRGLPDTLGLKGSLIRGLVRKYNETILVAIALHFRFGHITYFWFLGFIKSLCLIQPDGVGGTVFLSPGDVRKWRNRD